MDEARGLDRFRHSGEIPARERRVALFLLVADTVSTHCDLSGIRSYTAIVILRLLVWKTDVG